ncbi:MAG: PrgI family protein [Candidatus Pacebacteria bacterium]|nr:PrgI family protein [Candidatus Paceibacterota bacterium]
MKYQVPQFLEIEDKIFGPFTLKQFLYAGAGLAFAFVLWTSFPRFLAILIGVPVVSLFFGLAFWQVNDRPLVVVIEHAFKYLFAPKLYLWKKREKTPEKQAAEVLQRASLNVPKLSNSKLKDLSWGLDIHETLQTLDDIKPRE